MTGSEIPLPYLPVRHDDEAADTTQERGTGVLTDRIETVEGVALEGQGWLEGEVPGPLVGHSFPSANQPTTRYMVTAETRKRTAMMASSLRVRLISP